MGIIVQKFGGSSVADKVRLLNVCKHIIKEYEKNNKLVVVVSAQGKTTDKLIEEEKEISINPNNREHDVLVSVGEQITISKLAIYLNELGYYETITYDKMIEMAENGAKVLHTKCVKIAKENNVPIIVKSTFVGNEGTIVK